MRDVVHGPLIYDMPTCVKLVCAQYACKMPNYIKDQSLKGGLHERGIGKKMFEMQKSV